MIYYVYYMGVSPYPPPRENGLRFHEVGVKISWAPVRGIVKQAGDKIKRQMNTLINEYILTTNIEKNCMAFIKEN